jgi:hypothetical protein
VFATVVRADELLTTTLTRTGQITSTALFAISTARGGRRGGAARDRRCAAGGSA